MFTLAIWLVSTPFSLVVLAISIGVVHSSIAILFHVSALSAAEFTFVDVAVFVSLFQVSSKNDIILPRTFEHRSILHSHFSSAMLHVVAPLANVCLLLTAVLHFTMTMAFSITPATLVYVVHFATVCTESKLSFTMVLPVLELTDVLLTI